MIACNRLMAFRYSWRILLQSANNTIGATFYIIYNTIGAPNNTILYYLVKGPLDEVPLIISICI